MDLAAITRRRSLVIVVVPPQAGDPTQGHDEKEGDRHGDELGLIPPDLIHDFASLQR